MDKLSLIKESILRSKGLHTDFFAEAKTIFSMDSVMLDILQSEFDCMDSIVLLLEKLKFEDCFILLRHVFETFLYFWLMAKGEIYRVTREYNIIPEKSSQKEARDKTFDKWTKEWKAGLHKDIETIEKGGKNDEKIFVTYKWKGVFNSKDGKEAGQLVPWYVFAFQDYDPEIRFLANLPIICEQKEPRYRKIMLRRQKEQLKLYHRYFYIKSIIKNLRLNKLITDEQGSKIKIHYSFFSSFLHPNKKIIRTRNGKIAFNLPLKQEDVLSELILLYSCRLGFLFLSNAIDYFKKHYPLGKYTLYLEQARRLDEASRELWFFDNEPTKFDKERSKDRKWWLKRKKNGTTEENEILYYSDPIDRQQNYMYWKAGRNFL